MLAGQPCVALEAFAQTVLAAQALLVAAVGALCFYKGEEYQIAHRRRPAPRRRAGAASHRMRCGPQYAFGRAGSSGRARSDSLRAVGAGEARQPALCLLLR